MWFYFYNQMSLHVVEYQIYYGHDDYIYIDMLLVSTFVGVPGISFHNPRIMLRNEFGI